MESEQSLYNYARNRILGEMLPEVSEISPYFIMVLDRQALGILTSVVTMLDLTQGGVSVVESIDLIRKPLPGTDVLYFFTPEDQIMNSIIEDFKEFPKYRKVHMYSLTEIPDHHIRVLARSEIAQHIVSLKELNLTYKLVGRNAFSLQEPESLGAVLKSDIEILGNISKKLAHFFVNIGQMPNIYYWSVSNSSRLVCELLENELQALASKLPNINVAPTRATFIIVDRTFDMATPLAHSVYYEAMLKDFFEVGPEGHVKYKSTLNGEFQEAVINEEDSIWTEFRYVEIKAVEDELEEELFAFQQDNRDIEAAERHQLADVQQVARVVSNLNSYEEKVTEFAVHKYLSNSCLKHFIEKNVNEISGIEEILLTGIDSDRREISAEKLVKQIVKKMGEIRGEKTKIRLAMMTNVCLELSTKDKQAISNCLTGESALILNKLSHFGFSPSIQSSSFRRSKEEIKQFKAKTQEIRERFNYAIPEIAKVLDAAVNNKLEEANFSRANSAVVEEENKYEGLSLRKKNRPGGAAEGKTVIVFIIGGVSYTEIRCIEDYPGVNLIIGGSNIVSPPEFVGSFASIYTDPIYQGDVVLDFS